MDQRFDHALRQIAADHHDARGKEAGHGDDRIEQMAGGLPYPLRQRWRGDFLALQQAGEVLVADPRSQ